MRGDVIGCFYKFKKLFSQKDVPVDATDVCLDPRHIHLDCDSLSQSMKKKEEEKKYLPIKTFDCFSYLLTFYI